MVALVLMLLTAALVPCVAGFQQPEHLQHGGLQSSAKLLAAVGLPEGGHVDEGGAALPQVQRGVVGVVTQIPAGKPDGSF